VRPRGDHRIDFGRSSTGRQHRTHQSGPRSLRPYIKSGTLTSSRLRGQDRWTHQHLRRARFGRGALRTSTCTRSLACTVPRGTTMAKGDRTIATQVEMRTRSRKSQLPSSRCHGTGARRLAGMAPSRVPGHRLGQHARGDVVDGQGRSLVCSRLREGGPSMPEAAPSQRALDLAAVIGAQPRSPLRTKVRQKFPCAS